MIEAASIELSFGPATASRRRVAMAIALVGAPLSYGWLLALMRALDGEIRHPLGDPAPVPVAVYLAVFVAACVGVIRARPRARLSWDAWGVTERLGDGVLAALPWTSARYTAFGARHPTALCTIEADGREIRVKSRVVTSSADRFATSTALLDRVAQNRAARFRDASEEWQRPVLSFSEIVGSVGYVAAAAGLLGLAAGVPGAVGCLGVAFALLAARARDPVLVGWRLAALPPDAERVTLVENAGTLVTAVDAAGASLSFDVRPVDHADALVHTRRGAAWIVRAGAPPSTGAYRRGGLVEVRHLEMDDVVRARRRLRRALFLEGAARLLVAVMPLVPLALAA